MRFKTLICTVLMLCLVLTACGKGDAPSKDSSSNKSESATKSSRDYLTLLYSNADSFNPYTVKTDTNRQIVKLLYEPLVKVNDRFEAVNSVASSVEVKGNVCTVSLKLIKFSDGTELTAEDVVYSCELARNSETGYKDKLYEVQSVKADGKNVIFTLTKNDPYFANVLDFPIIKKGSDKLTNSDSVSLPPIGCGRFKLNETLDGLVENKYYKGKIENIKKIKLINAPDTESVAHYTEIGAADMYYTEISDGQITRMSGNRAEVNLNNLVYIGINQNYAPLNQANLRQAISSAVDRTKLCKTAYYNNALPATGFFHPSWKETSSVQNLQINANEEITVENLEEIGYNKLDGEGVRVNSNGTPLKFTLLVNSENRIRVLAANTIASQLKAVGISITVIERPYEQYLSALQSGSFQLYLGEIKLTDNMDISPLLTSGGSLGFGMPNIGATSTEGKEETDGETQEETVTVSQRSSSETVLKEFYNSNATIKDVAAVLQTDMPVVPLCYRTGVLFYNKNIKNVKNSSSGDIYFSIESYLIN